MGLNVWTEYLMFKYVWYANPQASNVPEILKKQLYFTTLMIAPALAFVKEKMHFYGIFSIPHKYFFNT